MSVRCKDLGIQLPSEGLDFCPTASATISGDQHGEETIIEMNSDLLLAKLREALKAT